MPRSSWRRGVLQASGQIVIIVVVLQGYRLARAAIEPTAAAALANTSRLVDFQERLGVAFEEGFQGWVLGHEWLVRSANAYYGVAHFAVVAGVLVLLWHRDRARYHRWRNVLGWLLVVGFVGFVTFPLAPPRLTPGTAFVDTAVEIGGFGPLGTAPDAGGGGNRFAAMPSLHAAWSLWAAAAAFPVLRRGWSRGLVVVHPVVMTVATVATANHWILDAVGGWVALGAAWALEEARVQAGAWLRRRRDDANPGESGTRPR